MAKKIINTALLNEIGQGAEMKENNNAVKEVMSDTDKILYNANKIFSLSLKFGDYQKLKNHCEANNISINGFIKELLKKESIL